MSNKIIRHPVGNFFIKRSIQVSIIFKILLLVFISIVLTTMVMTFIYKTKSHDGTFYYMSNDIDESISDINEVKQVIELSGILGLVLPAVISAQIVTLLIAIGIGMFSSRKIAVPLYKIEKWAIQLKNGNLKTRLAFRENKEMEDLTIQCNAVTDTYHSILSDIKNSTESIEKNINDEKKITYEVLKIKKVLNNIKLG